MKHYRVHLPDPEHPGEPSIDELPNAPTAQIYVTQAVGAWYLSAPEDPSDEDAVLEWHLMRPLIATNDAVWGTSAAFHLSELGAQILGDRIVELNDTIDRLISEGRAKTVNAMGDEVFGEGIDIADVELVDGHLPGCDGKCEERYQDAKREEVGIPDNYSPVAEMETFLAMMSRGL